MSDEPAALNTRQQAARSLTWTLLESSGLFGLSIVALVVFAHLLSPAEIGVATLALSVVQILNIPVEFLFHDALVQRRKIDELHFDTAHTVTVLLGIGLSIACWIGGGLVASLIGIREVGPVLAWMGLSLGAMGFSSVIIARQRREMAFRPLAIRSFVGRLAGALVGITIAFCGGGVWSLVAQQVLMVGLATAVLWLTCRERPHLRLSRSHFRDLLGFGVRSVAGTLLDFSSRRVLLMLVGSFLGAAATGYLNLAFRSVDMLRDLLAGAANQFALPLFSRHQGDPGQLRRTYGEAVAFTCVVAYPVFAGLAVGAREVVEIAFGPQWGGSVPYVAFMAILTLGFFPRLYAWSVVSAAGRPGLKIASLSTTLSVLIIGMLTVGRSSLDAAVAVWAVAVLGVMPLEVWILDRAARIGRLAQFAGVAKPLFAVAVMASAAYAAKLWAFAGLATGWRVAATAATGSIIYALLIFLIDRDVVHRLWEFAGLAWRRTPPAAAGQPRGGDELAVEAGLNTVRRFRSEG